MSHTLCCPKCKQKTVQMISHEPLTMMEYPFDKKLYGIFQCLQMHCHQIFRAILDISFKQESHPLDEISETYKAIEYLKSKGYYTDNLWCIDDVKMHYECSDAIAMRILDEAINSDPAYQAIFEQIHNSSSNFNLIKHESND